MYLHWFWSIFCKFELSSQSRFAGGCSSTAVSFSIQLFPCNTVDGISASFRMNCQKSSFTQRPKCRCRMINTCLAHNWSVFPCITKDCPPVHVTQEASIAEPSHVVGAHIIPQKAQTVCWSHPSQRWGAVLHWGDAGSFGISVGKAWALKAS